MRDEQQTILERRLRELNEASLNIRPPKEEKELLQEIVRLAVELVDGEAGWLYIHHSHLRQLELGPTYDRSGRKSSVFAQGVTEGRWPRTEGLAGLVIDSGDTRIINEFHKCSSRESLLQSCQFEAAIGVPLRIVGEVAGVLFVGKNTGGRTLTEADGEVEILERFANNAELAWQSSQLMGQGVRDLARMAILQRISDYVQVEPALDKVLHVVLTGITAGYGLGFNRAVLCLLDERKEYLIGKMGIGQVDREEARGAWKDDRQHKLRDIGTYITWLERNAPPETQVGKITPTLQFQVARPENELGSTDAFSKAIVEEHSIIVQSDDLDSLPKNFRRHLKSTSPVVVVPLKARNRVTGLLIADNEFTRAPMTDERVKALIAFVNTSAILIDNARLFRDLQSSRDKLESLFKASSALVSSQNPSEVLEDIVEGARVASQAAWVRMILVDEAGKPWKHIVKGIDAQLDLPSAIRPNGVSIGVIRSGKAEVIEDVRAQQSRVSPLVLKYRVGAAVCLPLSLQDKRIGVLWVNYDEPRRFSAIDIQGLKLYANQTTKAYADAQRLDELERMHNAAKAMAEASGLEQVLQTITERAQSLFQADSSAVWSYDNGLKKFIPNQLVASGLSESSRRAFKEAEPVEGGITYTVLERGLVDVSDISHSDAEFIRPVMRDLLRGGGIQSFEGIAMHAGEEPVAVLYVSYKERRAFTEEDRRRLRDFATHAALSLKKARLLDQVEKAKEAAHVVAHVTALGEGGLENTLYRIAHETQQVLGCAAVVLFAYDQLTQKLDHPPTMVGVRYPARASQSGEVDADSVVYKMLEKEGLYVVEDVAQDDLFKARRFAQDEGIRTCIAIPLRTRGHAVGVMFVNYRMPYRISSDERATIRLFAHQAAVAIVNAQLHERITKRARALQAIHEAGVAVTGSLELREILGRIAEQAWHLAGCEGDPIAFASIWLADTKEPKLVAAYPPETLDVALKALGTNGHLTPQRSGRIGVVGRVISTGATRLIRDVNKDVDFVQIFPEIHQQLAVPMKVGDEVIGVISIERPKYGGFDKGDQDSLECLAAQAAVAIQNARRFEDLKDIRGYVGSLTAFEWMKMVSQRWSHDIEGKVSAAKCEVKNVENSLGRCDVDEAKNRLRELRGIIEGVNVPIVPPLSAEYKIDLIHVNNFLKTYFDGRSSDKGWQVELRYEFESEIDSIGAVRASRPWLRELFKILVDNAVAAMLSASSPKRELIVGSRAMGDRVEVFIRDTGPGIPVDFLQHIFDKPKRKPDGTSGAGVGLMLAATIVRIYGGDIRVGSTGAGGTTIVVVLPLQKLSEERRGGASA